MSFVGYDPRALTRLADELTVAARHVESLLAHHLMATDLRRCRDLTAVVETLRQWAHRTRAIATCDVLERVHHVELPDVHLGDAPLRHLVPLAWQRAGLALVTVDEATAARRAEALTVVAHTLVDHPERVLADDDLTWLVQVARSDDEPLPADAVTVLLTHLATRCHRARQTGAPDPVAQHALDHLVAVTARQPTVMQQVLAELPVSTAAPLLAHAGLSGTTLGEVAAQMLAAWERERWWVLGRHVTHNVADHVLAAVVGDADALAALWAQRRHRPGLLLFGPNHADGVQRFVVALTDPRRVSMPVAAQRLLPVLHYLRSVPHEHAADLAGLRDHLVLATGHGDAHEVRWWQLRAAAAQATAPWVVWLTSGDHRWGPSSGAGMDTLRWLAEAPGATAAFARHLGPALQRRADALGDEPLERHDAIERMAWSIGVVDALVTHERQPGDAGLDVLRSLLAVSVGHAAGAAAAAATAVVAPPLAGVARTVSSGRVTEALDRDHRPPHHEHAQVASLDRRTTAAAALMAVVAADHRRRGGLSPRVGPPPPPTDAASPDPGAPDPLARWLASLDTFDEADVSADARRELRQVWDAVTPSTQRAAIDRGRSAVSR